MALMQVYLTSKVFKVLFVTLSYKESRFREDKGEQKLLRTKRNTRRVATVRRKRLISIAQVKVFNLRRCGK